MHLLGFLGRENLKGLKFLDIGSGSGINSLSAIRSGADFVLSMDYDHMSMASTERLRRQWMASEHFNENQRWEIIQGSILDQESVLHLRGLFDIAYSYGVLMTTGDTYKAIKNAAIPLKRDGLLHFAVYNFEVAEHVDTQKLLVEQYNTARVVGDYTRRKQIELIWGGLWIAAGARRFMNPFEFVTRPMERGMTFWSDVRDRAGGWPLDFVRARTVFEFADRELGMEVVRHRHWGQVEVLLRNKNPYGGLHFEHFSSFPSSPQVGPAATSVEKHISGRNAIDSDEKSTCPHASNICNAFHTVDEDLSESSSLASKYSKKIAYTPRKEMSWIQDQFRDKSVCWHLPYPTRDNFFHQGAMVRAEHSFLRSDQDRHLKMHFDSHKVGFWKRNGKNPEVSINPEILFSEENWNIPDENTGLRLENPTFSKRASWRIANTGVYSGLEGVQQKRFWKNRDFPVLWQINLFYASNAPFREFDKKWHAFLDRQNATSNQIHRGQK